MNVFSIDLGFDWNIKREGRDLHLQQCFYMAVPTIGTPSYFRVAGVGDMVHFNIFDITVNLQDSSPPTEPTRIIQEGRLTFRSADGNGPTSPFGSTVTVPLPAGTPLDEMGSLTFNGRYPHWQGEALEVSVAGKFVFMAELWVKQGSEEKYFIVDPEMETGPGG